MPPVSRLSVNKVHMQKGPGQAPGRVAGPGEPDPNLWLFPWSSHCSEMETGLPRSQGQFQKGLTDVWGTGWGWF